MNGQPDILLIQPPFGGPYNFWKSENLGLGYLASSLESKGYSVNIIDGFLLNMSVDEVVERVMACPPRILLGFSILSFQLYKTSQCIINKLKENGLVVHITLGSWFPTFWFKEILDESEHINSVVCGEGEIAIGMLADYIESGQWTPDISDILDLKKIKDAWIITQKTQPELLDILPNPRRDYMEFVFNEYHLITSHTSRGCGHNSCAFCSVPAFYRGKKSHRLRSAKSVIEEISSIAKSITNFVFFTDEDFIGGTLKSKERAIEIFKGLSELNGGFRFAINCPVKEVDETVFRRLRDFGLVAVYLGIESNHDRCLKRFGKGVSADDVNTTIEILTRLGVKIVPGWIMFERDTTFQEIQGSINFLKTIDCYHVNYIKSLYVMKDTPMEKHYGEDLYKTYFYSKYYYRDPQVDLLVRILMDDYLPEVMPFTNNIYSIWHQLLGGYGTLEQEAEYDYINRKIRDLSMCFIEEVMTRIRLRSLEGISIILTTQMEEWRSIGQKIDILALAIKNAL